MFYIASSTEIVHGVQYLWTSHLPTNIQYATLAIGGSFLIECVSLVVVMHTVQKRLSYSNAPSNKPKAKMQQLQHELIDAGERSGTYTYEQVIEGFGDCDSGDAQKIQVMGSL